MAVFSYTNDFSGLSGNPTNHLQVDENFLDVANFAREKVEFIGYYNTSETLTGTAAQGDIQFPNYNIAIPDEMEGVLAVAFCRRDDATGNAATVKLRVGTTYAGASDLKTFSVGDNSSPETATVTMIGANTTTTFSSHNIYVGADHTGSSDVTYCEGLLVLGWRNAPT